MTRVAESPNPITTNKTTTNQMPDARNPSDSVAASSFEYNERNDAVPRLPTEKSSEDGDFESVSFQRHRSQRSLGINGYTATPDPPPALYVRALYNYEADDHTSLSFQQGDTIQVLTQLESGWWDGVINDVRGWFPSNYCEVLSGPEDLGDYGPDDSEASAESGTGDEYDEMDEDEEDVDSDGNGAEDDPGLPIEGTGSGETEEAAYWIPQATPDGRLFYFNTLTGVSTMELPLETPSSLNETGPSNRANIHVPDQTRAPAGMPAHQEDSESEAEGGSFMLPSNGVLPHKRRSTDSDEASSATSMDSNASQLAELRKIKKGASLKHVEGGLETVGGASSTPNTIGLNRDLGVPRYFFDDGTAMPTTWTALVENMRRSVDSYRHAVRNHERAEFVRKAEDISDHLRMLLAAGSGTTDNHSGNPNIISTNQALNPHFRDMMSRFSKLVLSSHIAAADWPGPDAFAKCLQEADGVLHGVEGFVDVARQQRGEEIARLVPGFVLGGATGGNWKTNNIDVLDSANPSLRDSDRANPKAQSNAVLDTKLLSRIDEARQSLVANLRRLETQLKVSDKVITKARQNQLGDTICLTAGRVVESFKPLISLVESVNLRPLASTAQSPQLLELSNQKQQSYDNVTELVVSCQSITAALPDEWAEIRGPSLDEGLTAIGTVCRQLETSVGQMLFSLQLLMDAMTPQDSFKEVRMAPDPELSQKIPVRAAVPLKDTLSRPPLTAVNSTSSYDSVETLDVSEKMRQNKQAEKARRFFGQMPPMDLANGAPARPGGVEVMHNGDDNPWFLGLDHPNEVFYDSKVNPPQLKHGTLTGLVEQLTRHDRLDAVFNGTFLLTYRSFTTAQELFELLVRRFSIQPPAGISKQDLSTWEESKQKLVRFRVVNVLKSWLEHYWMEGNDDDSHHLLDRIYSFAKDSLATTTTPGSGPLMAVVEQRMKGQDTSAKRLVLTLSNSAPVPILPKKLQKLKFLDIDVTEFARQLTIIESKLYGKIKPFECLGKTWQKKARADEPDPAPNVKALILHSNQLTNWVAEMILSQAEVKKRVLVIKHFVSIADVS